MDVNLIHRLNATDFQIFAAITGGGQTFIGEYLRQSGGSKVFVGALVPYRQSVFDDFVKTKVDNYASEEAARKLAVAAYNTAVKYGASKDKAVGLGAASSLAKDGERVGRKHGINIAVHTKDSTDVVMFSLHQGRTRSQEEDIAARLILEMLAEVLVPESEKRAMPLFEDESFDYKNAGVIEHVQLVNGERDTVMNNVNISRCLSENEKVAIYPGSWNPFHDGHKAVIDMSKTILGVEPILELAVDNADKGQLDFIEIAKRSSLISDRPHILTRATTFVQKAHLFNQMFKDKLLVFVVGADTWVRLWEPKYGYAPEKVAEHMQACNAKFLVFPRSGISISNDYDRFRVIDNRLVNFDNPLNSSSLRKK